MLKENSICAIHGGPIQGIDNSQARRYCWGQKKGGLNFLYIRVSTNGTNRNCNLLFPVPYPVDKERMAKKLVRKSEQELWAEPRFHDTYELVCFQLSDTGVFRYFTFFKRKDSILKVKEAENEACKGLE